MCENVAGIAVTKISFNVISDAYIADWYWLSNGPIKFMTQSHFCRTLFEVFKANLDKLLEEIPDRPRTETLKPNCTDYYGNVSNSVKD